MGLRHTYFCVENILAQSEPVRLIFTHCSKSGLYGVSGMAGRLGLRPCAYIRLWSWRLALVLDKVHWRRHDGCVAIEVSGACLAGCVSNGPACFCAEPVFLGNVEVYESAMLCVGGCGTVYIALAV